MFRKTKRVRIVASALSLFLFISNQVCKGMVDFNSLEQKKT